MLHSYINIYGKCYDVGGFFLDTKHSVVIYHSMNYT